MNSASPTNVISRGTRWLVGGTGGFLLFGFVYFVGQTITGESLLLLLAGACAVVVACWPEDGLATSKVSRNWVRILCIASGAAEVVRATYYYSQGWLAEFSWTASVLLGLGLVSVWSDLRSYAKRV